MGQPKGPDLRFSALAAGVTSGLLVGPLAAAGQSQRYIVILKQRAGAAPDVASLGGVIESRQEDELVITLPPELSPL